MQLHQLEIKHLTKHSKRVGRGGKRGTYSGRGGKGQTARAGRNFKPIIREILKRYPKLRGYKNHAVSVGTQVINLNTLNAKYNQGETVNPRTIVAKNLAARLSGKNPQIKILGTGNISKGLKIRNCEVSKSAKEKIEKAGGSVK